MKNNQTLREWLAKVFEKARKKALKTVTPKEVKKTKKAKK